jgi:hypothetical protein
VEVGRIFHKLRSLANENFNEHFKSIFDVHGAVPTKGRTNTARFASWGRCWSTNSGCFTVIMSESWTSTAGSNPSSGPHEES